MAFCPRCGKSYEGAPLFCPNCGFALPASGASLSSASPSATPTGPSRQSHAARNVTVGVFIIVIILLVAYVAFNVGGSGAVNRPTSVQVSGSASTTGVSTHPSSIGFTSDTGQLYTSGVVNGQYSVNLPNDHSYLVQISWAGAFGSSGTCNAGSFAVSQGPGSSGLTENWSC